MSELREEIELRMVCPRCKGSRSVESIGFSSAGDMDAGNEPHQVVQSCYICKGRGKVCLPIEELETRLKSSLAANREQKAEIERLTKNYQTLLDDAVEMREQFASLRASAGEKPEDAWKRGWAVGYIDALNNVDVLRSKPYVPPTLPGEEK